MRLRRERSGGSGLTVGAAGAVILTVVVLAAVFLLLTGCGEAPGSGGDDAERAPEYATATLDGDSVSLAELEGEAVLLNVWATWCAPCRREIPELQALHEAHRDEGLHVVGVTVDSRHVEADIRSFIDEFGMTYDIWWDPDQAIVGKLGAVGVPLTVLIDRDGRIVWRHLGAFVRGDPELIRAVEGVLGAGVDG